jgi:NitT/TauT family transport system permease protein
VTAEGQFPRRGWRFLGKRSTRRLMGVLGDLVTILALLGLIEILLRILRTPDYLLPSPISIAEALIRYREILVQQFLPTLVETALGFAIGNSAAFLVAVLAVNVPSSSRMLLSAALFLRSVPIVALTPILTLWLGLGLAPKVAIVVLITFFPTLVVTIRGLTSIDPILLDLMRTLNAGWLAVLLRIRIPSSTPYIFSGLRIAAPSAVLGALVAEWLSSAQGIGHLMAVATFEFRTDLLWATIIVAAAFGVLSFGGVVLAQRLLCPWSTSEDG